ncbi:MAG: Asp-tRNA(Asn)/Glu-tRNA(Gln) amidotransferase subunit GatB, partial [Candidatus Saccharimonadales bacterium]
MAVTQDIKKNYTPTIGIECHIQLKTKTKLFAAVSNDARDAAPNTLISHICVGMPGALPYLNEAAVELAVRAAFAFNTTPQKFSKFDRKHYFYPDLPKGYQITQYEQPLIVGGHVDIEVEGKPKRIGITRVHLEEDAGKTSHPPGADYSLVDLNRAGTPLLEVVTEPDINSPAEAKSFAREIYLLIKYAGISDGDMYHGNLRFDVNISVTKEPGKRGMRSEVKNLNSFRSVEAAVAYEIERQIELLEKGQTVVQETRGWDEAKGKTIGQRGKEEAHDYRYMPEPDIPPLELDDEYVAKIQKELPELPGAIRKILNKLSITADVVEDILDNPAGLRLLLAAMEKGAFDEAAKHIAFWTLKVERALSDQEADIISNHLVKLARMREENILSSTAADEIFRLVLETLKDPEEIAKAKNLTQVSDEGEIEKIVEEVLAENQKAA